MAANKLRSRKEHDKDHDHAEDRREPAPEHRAESDGHGERAAERRTEAEARPAPAGVDRARSGVSLWSILSGVLVAFGAFVVIVAIVGSILAGSGVVEGGISPEDARTAGIGSAIGLVVAQFLSYLWGGYTAGRMARGSGVVNGILVAITALVLVVVLGSIVALIGPQTGVEAPDVQTFPLPLGELTDVTTGAGIGLVVAMLLGSALGGNMGARWHTKLEDTSLLARLR